MNLPLCDIGHIHVRPKLEGKSRLAAFCIYKIIVAALAFELNEHDGHTLPAVLA